MSVPHVGQPLAIPHRGVPENAASNCSTSSVAGNMNGPPDDVRHPSTSSGARTRDLVERRCTVWVHDEQFSKEEVLLNLDLFPANTIKTGDLMAIVALNTDNTVRDFQDRCASSKKVLENLPASFQPSLNGLDIEPHNECTCNIERDGDLESRYLFAVKDTSKELKSRQPSLEVSVAKRIADVFGFKHRAEVLLTTVSLAQSIYYVVMINRVAD
jgi:DEP domain-containing protein 5